MGNSIAKIYRLVSHPSMVSKIFEKLANNKLADHLKKCKLFCYFQYGFRSTCSTSDFLRVVYDKNVRVFNRFGATRAASLDISISFDRVWHAGLLHKLNFYRISDRVFCIISPFLSNRRLGLVFMGGLCNNIHLILVFLPFFSLKFCNYLLITFLMASSVILLSMLMFLLSTLSEIRHLICSCNCTWFLSLNLTYETLRTGAGSVLLISTLRNLNLFRLACRIILVLLMWKYESVLQEKAHFKMLGLFFFSRLDCGSYIVSITKTASNKTEALIERLWRVFLLSLLFISINLLYILACNTITMSGLVLRAAF